MMKRNRFAFWICRQGIDLLFGLADVKSFRKISLPQASAKLPNCDHPSPFFVDIINEYHLTLKPTVNIALFNATTCKWVKT